MDVLDQIKTNLDCNQTLQQDIKGEIMHQIEIFHSTFPDISLDTLNNKIAGVKISKMNLYDRRGPVVYDPVNNEILFSKKCLEGDYDANHMLMKGIIGMISACDNYYGFNKNNSLAALNLGVTEMLANTLVGNEGTCDFEEELLATNLISKIIGRDIMFEAFFNNDAETIFKKLLEAEVG